ncbi:acyl-CoA dehydratase activase [Acetohalobium arabaticum]|uniref:CoA-substrate-specific enzyme activase n=1 Tax=Acetohalobium arabaticum (strain ATCC 49924 / DSM 5501 / Z-7288) TaxID=574087 RepID=D9QUH8_ACEAZ|nr:acyl-CoA dehydratase activase [Acetohalobium arabaticum]ADL13779.1 CoA-substrate-specific enzyme activase [Acetohalobium arabaticum DSM 5501]
MKYFGGFDIGSRTCKGIIIDHSGELVTYRVIKTGPDNKERAKKIFEELQVEIESEVEEVVSTGYGRNNIEFADQEITEITCHARGINFLFPEVEVLIDIGGQDSKVIELDQAGKVINFSMNNKCAAGTGKFLEMMALTLDIDINRLGELAKKSDEPISLSNVCSVFAESEVISHLHSGVKIENIVGGLCNSVANQIMKQVKSIGKSESIAMSGGVAKNSGVVKALEKKLNQNLKVADKPQLVGALGAALLARERS